MNGNAAQDVLFEKHPDPMWIYDLASLRILAANEEALRRLGYTRDEFLQMTIADLRAEEDVPALMQAVSAMTEGLDEIGVHRLFAKSGEAFFADIRAQSIDWAGTRAKLACARDVTRLVEMEQERTSLLGKEQEHRRTAEALARQFQAVFQAVPGRFLVLTPERYEIVAASDAYLESTQTHLNDIRGRRLFEVFPDDPSDPQADGTRNLRASLERVVASGRTDVMAVQRYPIRRPAAAGGGFEERYWAPVNTPVPDLDGHVAFIIHRVDDVTELVGARGDPAEVDRRDPAGALDDQLRLELLLRSRELREANRRIEEQEASLRTAKRLLDVGTWKLEMQTGRVTWSDNLYEMHGVARMAFGHRFEDYVALVHPDDRPTMLSEFEAFRRSGARHFSFHHRVVRPDGRVIHVRGLGELSAGPRGEVINGLSQDVTAQVETGARLAAAADLLRIAGRIGKVGGWRVVLGEDEVEWSEETANIHGLTGPRRLPVEEAIGFYTPDGRERIRRAFRECAAFGKPWDEVLRIVTATGRHAWVRAIGEAARAPDGTIVAVRGAFQDISEIVAARQRAEDLAERLHETLNSMSDAFFTLDREWRFSFLNDHALLLLGRDRDALMGRYIWQEFPEAVGTSFQTYYEAAVSERQTVRFTEFYPPLEKWFQVTAYPVPEGLAVYFRDITQERADQAQLRLLETAVSRQGDMLVITEAEPIDRPEGPRIVYVNDAFARITGYERDEVIGKTPRILQGPATQPGELRCIREALSAGRAVRAEVLNYTKAGQELWLELDIVPIADESGRLSHWVAVQRDVTERRRAEEAMRISEERFRLIARATNDVVWDWDFLAGRVWWNDTMASLFGYKIDRLEPGPESWASRIHPEDADRVLAGIHAVIDGEGTAWADEYRFLRADGSAAIVADRGFVIRAPDGTAIRMLGSMHDITERRRLDERLRESQKLEALGRLTGGIAHDFNNLLTVVLGNAEIVAERLAGQSDLHALAEMIASAAERGAELTDRLLAFARRQPLEPATVDLRALIGGMGALLRRAVPDSIELQVVQCADACVADVDTSSFEGALLNLVINARDAMPDGGRLAIESACIDLTEAAAVAVGGLGAGPYVRVSVTDTGAGMSPEVVARAFDPFFTTKEVGRGSGLGLSMVYGFVKQSGGEARILSQPGRGTTVELYLPSSRTAPSGDDVSPVTAEDIGGPEHILVVEDDDLVRRQASALLGTLGYRVTAVEGGAPALEVLAGGDDVDLLFTDVMMPGMNGPQLREAALKLRPGLKVLFTSGFADDVLARNGRLDPDVHLLPKPYRRRDLALRIRRVLDE